jgi:glycosyltransferase involved in cell wall biosynthesis
MRIAQLATNVESVPPSGYGGTELVVSLLTEELVRRGHEVTLFGTGDSTTGARLVSTVEKPLREVGLNPTQWPAFDIRTCLTLQKMQHEFDVIHNHMGFQALPFLDAMDCAVVTTLHNHIKDYCKDIFFAYRKLPFVAISNSYAQLNYPNDINYIATIYNGIDVDAFNYPHPVNRDNLLFVGRLGYDKGTAAAIDIARELDLPINVAGKIDKADEPYYQAEIQPRIKSYAKAEYVGEVNHQQKVKLYANAIAVVYPINFNEPFGLVMAESLAAGTPVMALDRGSVREILENGTTAVIGASTDELVARYPEVSKIDHEVCKQRVREHFGVSRMVDKYEQVYQDLLRRRSK